MPLIQKPGQRLLLVVMFVSMLWLVCWCGGASEGFTPGEALAHNKALI